jgi:Fungal Zn(2)-Cys(6) binuclear cluster domain
MIDPRFRPGFAYATPYGNQTNPHERHLQLTQPFPQQLQQQQHQQQQQQQQPQQLLLPAHMGIPYPTMMVRTDFDLAPSQQQNLYHQHQQQFRQQQQQQPVHEASAAYYHRQQQQLLRDAPMSFAALQSQQPRCLESLPSLHQHIAAMPFNTTVAPLMSAYDATAAAALPVPVPAPPAAAPAKAGKQRKQDASLPSDPASVAQRAAESKLLERASKAAAQQRRKIHPPPSEAYLLDRRRLRKSCNSCVRAKRRCDGNWPCSRCASGNKECQYR